MKIRCQIHIPGHGWFIFYDEAENEETLFRHGFYAVRKLFLHEANKDVSPEFSRGTIWDMDKDPSEKIGIYSISDKS